MKTYLARLCSLLSVGLLLTSCNLGTYVPAHQNVPLFQKKGEAHVSINTTNLQAAVAVGNHIGVALNMFAVINGQKFLSKGAIYNQRRAEVAVGYFTLQKNARKSHCRGVSRRGYGHCRATLE
ncbi:hypothetical protein [uncultured Fibrella sp.]|uniref:hypothetical protein n=1 Tax=uncultured Fibrella sp. TaxID=1284596 RepID=UPI0035C9FD3E